MTLTKPVNIALALLYALLLTLPGCMTNPKVIHLQDTLRAYDATIRWGAYHRAAGFQTKDKRREGLDLSHLKSIRVTGYSQSQASMAQDTDQYTRIVEIRYYDEDYAKEKVIVNKQKWIYDDDVDAWRLDSDLPAFFYSKK